MLLVIFGKLIANKFTRLSEFPIICYLIFGTGLFAVVHLLSCISVSCISDGA